MKLLRAFALAAGCSTIAAGIANSVAGTPGGGGYLHAGLRGSYFSNTDLTGAPAFTRKDPRIDFAWGTLGRPGGSRGSGFTSLGSDHFSVRWSGQLQARFSENYTFTLIADDGARLRIKPANGGAWTTLIDAWNQTGLATNQAGFAFSEAATYDLELDYREVTDEATVRLLWSSPSTPSEIIDPAFEVSVNWTTYEETTFADAIMNGRSSWEGTALDTTGWPVGDGDYIVSEILAPYAPSPLEVGRMRLTFSGSANLAVLGNGFLVPGSYSYDAVNNLSSAWVQGTNFGANVLLLRFTNTSRTGATNGPGGVTNVKLMRPLEPGSTNSLSPDTIFHPSARSAFAERLTALRYQRVNDQARDWHERTPPWFPYQGNGRWLPFVYNSRYGSSDFGNSRMSHEFEIMLCNETGCDYFVGVPHLATVSGITNYVRQLALLIRHGGDSNGIPYPAPVANPFYPPLNSNLRVYVEISNELWNFLARSTYSPYWDLRELIEDFADANSPEFQILNFDNLPLTLQPDGYYVNNYTWVRRYWGYKLRQISEEFRTVFGDAAMPGSGPQPRIRPYLGYQYANANNTAEIPFEFLDNYFNNAAGNFVATPRPVNSHVFAAGGAGYYGSGNPSGSTTGLLANFSFETPVVVTNSPAPANASWTFTGNSGIAPNASRAAVVTNQTLGTLRNDFNGWVGMRFTVGAQPVWACELGRYIHNGNTRAHAMVLLDAAGQLVTFSTDALATTPGEFSYAPCVPVQLQANTSYLLLTREETGYDQFAEAGTTVSTDAAITIEGAVTAAQLGSTTWATTNAANGAFAFGPVNLRVATAAALGNPDAAHGSQVAWIGGASGTNGAIEIQFNAPPGSGTGVYGLAFRAVQRTRTASSQPDSQSLRITADGVDITYRGINGQPQVFNPNFPWRRISYWIGDYFFSETFSATAVQPVTLRIEGTSANGDQLCFLDDIQITSVDAIFAGGIPDTGEATGQPNGGDYVQGIRTDARWAHSYGLHHMTYEHGWSIGGDSGASPVQEFAKYRDARTAATMSDCLEIFHRAGGANATFGTYSTWPLFSENVREEGAIDPGAWPLVQGLDSTWNALAAAVDNGVPVPAQLNSANRAIGFNTTENRIDAREWLAWNLIVTERGNYRFAFDLFGGGNVRATLNESQQLFAGAMNSPTSLVVTLAPGLHTLKVKGISGSALFTNNLLVTLDATPAAPTLLSATDGNQRVTLAWSTVTNSASYVIRFGTQSGFPNQTIEVGTNTQFQINHLQNGVPHFFTVLARNANGLGLPSNELGVTPFGDGESATLVAWDFAGQSGNALSASAALASSRVSASTLTRGAGFGPTGWAPENCFLGGSTTWAQTLPAAVAGAHYVEFTLTPRNGRRVSVESLNYRPGFQNFTGQTNDPRGTGVAWRIGGGTFSSPIAVQGPRTASLNFCPLFATNLSSFSELQNVSEPITFRIYFHGQSNYEGASIGGPDNDVFVIGALASPPLIQWRELHQLNLDGANDGDTPANDSMPNLVKYAFNLAPNPGDLEAALTNRLLLFNGMAGLPNGWLTNNPSRFVFQFLRRRTETEPGISYTPLRSTNLMTWLAPASAPLVQALDGTWERVSYIEQLTNGPAFYRVAVAAE